MNKNLLKLTLMLAMSMLVVFSSCKKDDDEDDDNTTPTIVLDGVYIKGAATALTTFDAKGMMEKTRNEVTQTDRDELMEIYMAVSATGGFNIVKVDGSTQTTYGPGTDFAEVTTPTNDEPHGAAFWRGSYVESTTEFTVPEDGLYHIIIDTELEKVVIAKVDYWAVIGGATLLGWGSDTELPSQGFDLNTMTFKAENVQLSNGEFKFRYSGGWKIEIDTTYDLGGGQKGIKVNTNYGNTADDLVPGGSNIVNSTPGLYTIEMVWTLGEGYTATVTKTADVPNTDWTNVPLELIGTGVSIDNPAALDDTSSWNWGNVLLCDNGIPTVNGDVYTWTWTGAIIEANEGFKIRTINGLPPVNGNGANFDAGYALLDATTSSALIVDNGGNLSATTKTAFDITITIDAANADAKVITITEAK